MVTIATNNALRLVKRYRGDWAAWGKEQLDVRFTPQQLEVLDSVQLAASEEQRDGVLRRVAVSSGNGVGKTWLAAFCQLAHVALYVSLNFATSSSLFQVKHRLWAEFRRLYRRSKVPIGGILNKLTLEFDDKWNAVATATKDGSNVQGGHARHQSFVFDEAQAVDPTIWEAVEGMMGSEGAWWLAIYNPLFTSGAAWEASRRPDMWRTHVLSCLEHPNVLSRRNLFHGAVTHQWVEERRADWGEDSPLWYARVLGIYPPTSEDTLLSLEDLEKASDVVPVNEHEGIWLGQDVARYGSDFNRAAVNENGRIVFMDGWSGLDTMYTTGRMLRIAEEFDIPDDHINVDGNGVGAAVVDRSRELGHAVNDVQLGGGPVGDWIGLTGSEEFINRRAELHWVVRKLVKRMRLSIPRRYTRAWSDLMSPRYSFRSDTAIKIESKEDIKKRIGRSPDDGDAVVLSCARDKNAIPTVTLVGGQR